ncbi:phosphoglycerate mutase family protein [Zunongwangia sp. F363]|uniref:Phosphoglycerate mutase family protein n=1 Tax=Autumnicola tepida TaxID=3075595 RepID=A0ABU3CC83_9FLAO|nr:phosphoglycerate mutase family protein [Zunongwangia sp. F363]MDT0643888.1 phosphoglycerate mutase family protein [Zunongwangia sp. F363]
MKNFFILSLLFLANFMNINTSAEGNIAVKKALSQTYEGTTYFLIRHAEKDRSNPADNNPSLNEEGKARAQKWAEVLADVPLDAIYSTDFSRTRETAKEVAKSKNLDINTYDHHNLYDEDFQNRTKGKKVLVVGHSNTTPQFVNAILQQRKYEDLPDDENGALFIVNIDPQGNPTSQMLYIN